MHKCKSIYFSEKTFILTLNYGQNLNSYKNFHKLWQNFKIKIECKNGIIYYFSYEKANKI